MEQEQHQAILLVPPEVRSMSCQDPDKCPSDWMSAQVCCCELCVCQCVTLWE